MYTILIAYVAKMYLLFLVEGLGYCSESRLLSVMVYTFWNLDYALRG